MEYSKLLSMLRDNMHYESWVSSTDQNNLPTFALRDDVSVSITKMPEEENNRVSNDFTDCFMNKTASLHYFTLNYNGSVIKNILLYMVDGGRAYIPSTRLVDGNYIQDDELIIGVIIDRVTFYTRYVHDDTVNYLKRAGMIYQEALIN